MSQKFYVVTVKRVLEEIYTMEIEADTVDEARADAAEAALSEPPNHWRYHPKMWAVVKKVRRA
jgi:hypothetical protein